MKKKERNNNQTEKKGQSFVSLKNDYAFTQIMKNKMVLQGFLAAVLDVKAEEILGIQVEDRHLKKVLLEGKLGILDVRLTVAGYGDIDIELQVQKYQYWGERSVFYTSTMYLEDLKKGEGYEQCRKVIHISILGFDFCNDTDYFYSSFHIREDERNTLYSDALEYHVIELKKLACSVRKKHLALHKWACLINTEREEERMEMEQDPYIKEALRELEELGRDPERMAEYNARDIALRDYVTQMYTAKEEGREEGREGHLISQVLSKYSKGLPAATIAEHLEIMEKEVTAIIRIIRQYPDSTVDELTHKYLQTSKGA